jgi:hypothetical protein
MIIKNISGLSVMPKPALGLLPALHDAEVEDTLFQDGVVVLPSASDARGMVFRNQGNEPIALPEYGKWPQRQLPPGGLYGSDGRLYYPVTHKQGTTSYYPTHFERTVYTFSFTGRTLPIGGACLFEKYFCFRLFANNTTAVWSVVMEVGEKVMQMSPDLVVEIPVDVVQGEKRVVIADPLIGKLVYNMKVTGDGVFDVNAWPGGSVRVSEIDIAGGSVLLTRAALVSGRRTLVFSAPVGPNLDGYKWLPPLIDEQILLTDSMSKNLFGVQLINWGSPYIELPQGGTVLDRNRNERGMEGLSKIYGVERNVLPECLPLAEEFLLRVRIGQFDTENDVVDPRGYAAYLIVSEDGLDKA